MLELIVLGQIPGTHIQVSYAGFVVILFALVAVYDLRRKLPRLQIKKIIANQKLSHAKA